MIDTDDEEYLEESCSDDYEDHYFEDSDNYYDELIESLRDEARFWAEKADESFRDFRFALKFGDGESVKIFDDAVIYFRKCMKEANDTAAEIAFERNNENRPFHIIDLHRLFVTEAIVKLTDRVNDAITNSVQELIVIVGRGYHSVDGPKLKTAVANFAFNNNIRCGLDPSNPGRIELCLEDASEIPSQETESDASVYLYNRSKEVTLSEYFSQTQPKKQRRQPSKNKKNTTQRATDRSGKVSSSVTVTETQQKTHIPLNVKLSQKQKKRKCNDRSNATTTLNTSHFERKDQILKLENGSGDIQPHLRQSSKNRKTTTRHANNHPNEMASPADPFQLNQKDTACISQHTNGQPSKNLKHNAQRTIDRPNKMQSSVDTFQIERKDSNHILLNVNETGKSLNDSSPVSICAFVFVFLGTILIAKLCGL